MRARSHAHVRVRLLSTLAAQQPWSGFTVGLTRSSCSPAQPVPSQSPWHSQDSTWSRRWALGTPSCQPTVGRRSTLEDLIPHLPRAAPPPTRSTRSRQHQAYVDVATRTAHHQVRICAATASERRGSRPSNGWWPSRAVATVFSKAVSHPRGCASVMWTLLPERLTT